MLNFFGGFMLYTGREAGEREHINYEYFVCMLRIKKVIVLLNWGVWNAAHWRLDLGAQWYHVAPLALGQAFPTWQAK